METAQSSSSREIVSPNTVAVAAFAPLATAEVTSITPQVAVPSEAICGSIGESSRTPGVILASSSCHRRVSIPAIRLDAAIKYSPSGSPRIGTPSQDTPRETPSQSQRWPPVQRSPPGSRPANQPRAATWVTETKIGRSQGWSWLRRIGCSPCHGERSSAAATPRVRFMLPARGVTVRFQPACPENFRTPQRRPKTPASISRPAARHRPRQAFVHWRHARADQTRQPPKPRTARRGGSQLWPTDRPRRARHRQDPRHHPPHCPSDRRTHRQTRRDRRRHIYGQGHPAGLPRTSRRPHRRKPR